MSRSIITVPYFSSEVNSPIRNYRSQSLKEALEARVAIEPTIKDLQSSALPLGYRACKNPYGIRYAEALDK